MYISLTTGAADRIEWCSPKASEIKHDLCRIIPIAISLSSLSFVKKKHTSKNKGYVEEGNPGHPNLTPAPKCEEGEEGRRVRHLREYKHHFDILSHDMAI